MSLVAGILSVSLALFPSAQGNPGAPALAKPAVQLRVGDKAPPIEVEAFLRGEPFEAFEAGRVYVLEFWATWCGPCIGAMPHLSELQARYKDRVTVLGVDVWEDKEHGPGGSLDKVRASTSLL